MSIQFLSISDLQSALTAMWQADLGTGQDPANGQWYTSGSNGDSIGLYGGLTDALPTSLNLNTAGTIYTPQTIICSSTVVNNLNGLTPRQNIELSYTYSDTTSYSQTVGTSINTGVSVTLDVSTPIAEGSTTFELGFTWSSSNTTETAKTETTTWKQSMEIDVPKGAVYQVALSATRQSLTVPYTAQITVTGETETWFGSTVNGHYNWILQAPTAFALINQYGSAGSDSSNYGSNGSAGTYTIASGSVTMGQTVDFVVETYDVTSQYSGSSNAAATSAAIVPPANRVLAPGASPVPKGKLVSTKRF